MNGTMLYNAVVFLRSGINVELFPYVNSFIKIIRNTFDKASTF